MGTSQCTRSQCRNTMGLPSNGRKGRQPRWRRSDKPADTGKCPLIGGTEDHPLDRSMRMKGIEDEIVDGHGVHVLPPGSAQGLYPANHVSVRS